jgi:hypothetical protein
MAEMTTPTTGGTTSQKPTRLHIARMDPVMASPSVPVSGAATGYGVGVGRRREAPYIVMHCRVALGQEDSLPEAVEARQAVARCLISFDLLMTPTA